MSPYLIAAAILAVVILTFLATKWFSRQPTPQIVLDAEAEAWEKLEELVEFVADSKGDQKAIAQLNAKIAARAQRVADFKAKVGALPSV